MGNGSSSEASRLGCRYCAKPLPVPSTEQERSNTVIRCERCHGISHKPQDTSFFDRFRSDSNTNAITLSPNEILPIEHLWIAPFAETLEEIEEKQVDTRIIHDSYLRPYFDSHPKLICYAGLHIVVKAVHFKVYGAHPPAGVVTEQTNIHLSDSDMENDLKVFKHQTVRRIHVVPTFTSFHASKMYQKLVPSQPSQRQQRVPQQPSPDKVKRAVDALFESHVKPYLQRNPIFAEEKEEKMELLQHEDPNGFVHIDDKESSQSLLQNEQKEQDKQPTQTNHRTDVSRHIERRDKRYDKRLHLSEGETFVSKGIQFRVMACEPKEGGHITNDTMVHCEGLPVNDIQHLRLSPVYESIPNSHKNFTPQQIHEEYILPYIRGCWRYIDRTRELHARGVTFTVLVCGPTDGIVTCETKIDMANPLTADDLRERQMRADEDLARRLQAEQSRQQPQFVIQFPSGNRQGAPFVIRTMRRGDQRGQPVGMDANFTDFMQILSQFQEHLQQRQDASRSLPQPIIDQLPTWEFKPPGKDESETDENLSCRICLEAYEEGEVLRVLPCFHRYHKECIDRWFGMNRKCPICKMDVTQGFG